MKKTIIFSVLVSLAITAQAQFSQFHAGLVFPSGKFGDGNEKTENIGDGKGFAATGFTIGYKHYSPLSAENLSWVFGIEAFYNALNSDYKDYYEDHSGYKDITFPIYLNFPVTFGLNYSIPLNGESLKIYGEVALGANYSMLTNYINEDRPEYYDREFIFTPAFGLAYGLEGGLFINNKYSIGLKYNNLGSYKYKYKIEYSDGTDKKDKYNKALPITSLSLSLGILF
jgi:hypothetical protein